MCIKRAFITCFVENNIQFFLPFYLKGCLCITSCRFCLLLKIPQWHKGFLFWHNYWAFIRNCLDTRIPNICMFPLALTVERTGELHIHHLSKLKVCFDCFNLWGKGAFKGPIYDIQPQSGRSGDNYLLHKDIVEQRRPELPLLGTNIRVKTVFAWKKGYWTFNTSKVAQVRRNTSTCIMLPTLLVTEANTGQYVHPLTCPIYLQHHFAQSTKG